MSAPQQATGSFNIGNPISGSFGAPTQQGSLLLCTAAAVGSSSSSSSPAPTINLPVTPGFTWELLASASNNVWSYQGGQYLTETVYVFGIAGAASMPEGLETTVTAVPAPGASLAIFGFQLIEWAGLAASSPVDIVVSASGQQPNPATAGPIVTTNADLILCFFTDPNFDTEVSAGPGYTLIPTGGVGSGYGDVQYMQTFAPGSYPTAFGTEIYGPWAMVAIGLLPGPSPLPIIPAATTGFTPLYPPTKKQPFGCWGLDAKRADSITADGIKESVLDRLDSVTTLHFPFVALSDMPAWKAFEEYALTGGVFTYLALPDYPPGADSGNPLEDSMFQYPGTVSGETGCSLCQLVSMEWTPKFESFQTFSLEMKLRLVRDQVGS